MCYIHILIAQVFVSIVFGQFSPNLVQNSDVSVYGDGLNGYGFGPKGLAMDSNGRIFFTEGNTVRMANYSGYVTTVSGANTIPQGIFNGTSGIAVDSFGNLIVADSLNNQIKRIDMNGRVSVIGTTGNSPVTMVSTFATGFDHPLNIAFDSLSNLYVGDYSNTAVKKIFPNGTVVTLAPITYPSGMAVDSIGNVYVGYGDLTVYKITPAGSFSSLAGSGFGFADGTGSSASFYIPYPGAVDGSGNVYIADNGNNRIRKITSAGVVTTIAGSGAASSIDGQGTSASFYSPVDLKLDASGNLIVVESIGCKVRKISVSGAVTTIAGNGTCTSVDGQGTFASFNGPAALTLDGKGNIYVSDYGSSTIRMINSSNYVSTFAGFNGLGYVNGGLPMAQFNGTIGLAIDPNTGNLFLVDNGNNVIRKFTFNQKSVPALPFKTPTGVAVDSIGNIFIADQQSHMIKFIDTTGMVNVLAGSGNASFANGNGISAGFSSPYGIALDLYGNVIVADTGNNMIRNVSKSGSVTTIAGNGTAGWVDGQGANSLLSSPLGVSVDGMNRVFVTDSANNCIRVINSTGYVNTLFLGRGSNLALNAPQGILAARNGDLFIADTGNKRIRTVPASMLVGRI